MSRPVLPVYDPYKVKPSERNTTLKVLKATRARLIAHRDALMVEIERLTKELDRLLK